MLGFVTVRVEGIPELERRLRDEIAGVIRRFARGEDSRVEKRLNEVADVFEDKD